MPIYEDDIANIGAAGSIPAKLHLASVTEGDLLTQVGKPTHLLYEALAGVGKSA